MSLPDHPVIRNMERTGSPSGKNPVYPICPICGAKCGEVYVRDRRGYIVGCRECISLMSAWERDECFPEED